MHGFWEQCVVLFPKFHVVLSPIVDALLGSIFLSDFSLLFPWCRTKKRNLHLNICYQTVWVRRCKTPTSAKPNHSFHVSFYSGTTKETPELKFRLSFFFFSFGRKSQSSPHHACATFDSAACATFLLMNTWHGVMADKEKYKKGKISYPSIFNIVIL